MKVFQVLNDCQIIIGEEITETFAKGKFYISSEDYFSKISMFIGGAIGIEIPFSEIYNKYEGQDLNGKKLFAMRHGGGGDILFMLTALRELKRRYKNSSISIAIREQYNALVLKQTEREKERPDHIDQKNSKDFKEFKPPQYLSRSEREKESLLTSLRTDKSVKTDESSETSASYRCDKSTPSSDENINLIDNIYSLPIPLDIWNQFHYHLTFENLIENNPDAKRYNAYDLFMKQAGLDIKQVSPENKIPIIELEENEKRFKIMEFPHLANKSPKVGIQIKTSSPIRTYPPYNYIKISQELVKKGYDVYLFGGMGEHALIEQLIKEIGIGGYNVAQKSLRGSIVAASMMDFFIAPDSMFIHIAGAFRIPTIGIYGPFHSETRMKYFKNSVGIDMNVGCSPCFLHGHQPCPKGDPSPCFSLVTPKIVLEAFDRLEEEVND